MFERFKRSRERDYNGYEDGPAFQRGNGYTDETATRADGTGTRTAVVDRTDGADRAAVADRTATQRPVADRPATTTRPTTAQEARALQRDRFGGADGTAIFFGWLSALGLAALLLAVVGAAGTRLGFAQDVSTNDATSNAGTIGIVGAAILVVVLLLAYYGGGYVAGRMARFDGGRQGFRVWLLGLLVTIAAAIAGWIGGSQYNVFEQLNLPRIPVDEGTIATGAIVTLAVVLIGTLLASVAGGKAGDRYHARVDALAWDRDA
jgi:hypothetical protein